MQFLSSRRLSEPGRENSSAASGPITHELFLGMRPSSLLHRKLLVAAVQHALDQYNLKLQAETPQRSLFSAVNQLALLLQHIMLCQPRTIYVSVQISTYTAHQEASPRAVPVHYLQFCLWINKRRLCMFKFSTILYLAANRLATHTKFIKLKRTHAR